LHLIKGNLENIMLKQGLFYNILQILVDTIQKSTKEKT
jgi:hypothetical protein